MKGMRYDVNAHVTFSSKKSCFFLSIRACGKSFFNKKEKVNKRTTGVQFFTIITIVNLAMNIIITDYFFIFEFKFIKKLNS